MEFEKVINNNLMSFMDEGPHDALPIIMIHGFPFNKQMWRIQADALKKNFRVITYDVRGHGGSAVGDTEYSIDLFVEDLICLMDALKVEKALVCGLSMGGYIALRALEQYPNRFLGLILCDTQCMADTPEGKEKRLKAIENIKTHGVQLYAKASIQNLFAEQSFQTKPEIVSTIQQTIENTSPETICRTLIALAHRQETCSRLKEIQIPTLVLVGREDKITPITTATLMHEKIKSSVLVIVEQAGHLTNLENPEEFNSQLTRFMKSLV